MRRLLVIANMRCDRMAGITPPGYGPKPLPIDCRSDLTIAPISVENAAAMNECGVGFS